MTPSMAGPSSPTSLKGWTMAAGVLSLLAAMVHGIVTPEHLAEWWGYGAFFIVAAVAQALYAMILFSIRDPLQLPPRSYTYRQWHGLIDGLLIAGILGNLAIIALYIVTRTVGIPSFGPEAGEVEPIGRYDVASKTFELGLIVCLAYLWFQVRAARDPTA